MLIRMISSIAKWRNTIGREGALFSGDAISDLRTTNNTISVWYVPDEQPDDIDKIALALASQRDNFSKLVLVKLSEEFIQKHSIETRQVKAENSPIKDESVLAMHHDIIEVDYWHLGFIAEHICELIDHGEGITTYSVQQMKKMLIEAYQKDELDVSKMKDELCKKIQEAI